MKRGCLAAGAVAGVILGVLLVRAVERAREDARRSQCLGNLKWIAVALHNYHAEFASFPTGTVPNPALSPDRRLGWTALAWPWLHGYGMAWQTDATRAWDEPPNWPPKFEPLPNVTYVDGFQTDHPGFATCCPDEPAVRYDARPLPLSYIGVAGVGPDAPALPAKHPRAGVFGFDRATRLADITDGPAQTLLLLETARDSKPWTAGAPGVRGLDPAARPHLGRGRPFGGFHPGGANAAFADGSVRFLRDSIAPSVLEALSTIAGGEALPDE